MNSGQRPEPPERGDTPAPPDRTSGEDADLEWTAWRQGPGYSRPLPPEPETGSRARAGGRRQRPGEADGGDYGAPGRYGLHGGPGEPEGADYGVLGRYGLFGGHGEPAAGDEPGSAGSAGSAGRAGRGGEDFGDFWRPGHRGGVHASRPGSQRTPGRPPPLPAPGLPGEYQPPPRRESRQAGFLIAVAAVIVVAGTITALMLLGHHGHPRHAAAGRPSTPASSLLPTTAPTSAAPAASPPGTPPPAPPRTGAAGHLGVPRQIGTLRINPWLSGKYAGPPVRLADANAFYIPARDVVGGFYTTDPAVDGFTASQPRLMFLAAYLAGTGNPGSALRTFMRSHLFYGQRQVSPGPLGGVAACGLLQQQTGPVAHCIWADADTYADFYAWGTSPASLARTMISIRPQVELPRS